MQELVAAAHSKPLSQRPKRKASMKQNQRKTSSYNSSTSLTPTKDPNRISNNGEFRLYEEAQVIATQVIENKKRSIDSSKQTSKKNKTNSVSVYIIPLIRFLCLELFDHRNPKKEITENSVDVIFP